LIRQRRALTRKEILIRKRKTRRAKMRGTLRELGPATRNLHSHLKASRVLETRPLIRRRKRRAARKGRPRAILERKTPRRRKKRRRC